MYRSFRFLSAATALLLLCNAAQGQSMPGVPGSGSGGTGDERWCSAWWDLATVQSFDAGTIVCVRVMGPKNVFVRLLPKTGDPQTSIGVIGGLRNVPQNSAIAVTLGEAQNDVRQISVHGCASAFNVPIPDNLSDGTIKISGVSQVTSEQECR